MNAKNRTSPKSAQRTTSAHSEAGSKSAPVVFTGLASIVGVAPVMSLGPFALLMRNTVPIDDTALGLLFALFFVGALIGATSGAWFLSRFGGKQTVALGTLIAGAGGVAIGVASSMSILLVISVAAGFANGLVQPGVNVYIMRNVAENLRGFAFGLRVAGVPAASGLSSLCATLIVSLDINWRWYFFAVAAVSTVLSITALLHRSHEVEPAVSKRGAASRRLNRRVLVLSASGLLASTATSVLAPFLVGALVWKGTSFSLAAIVVAVAGGLGALSRVSVGLIADKAGSSRTHLAISLIMLLVCGVGMTGMGLLPGVPAAIVAAIASYGIGWAWPGLVIYAAMAMNPRQQSTVATLMQFGTFFGAIVGPAVFGTMVGSGYQELAWCVFGAIAVIAAAGLAFVILDKRRGADRTSN